MATLQIWSPWREVNLFGRDFDRMFNGFFNGGTTAFRPTVSYAPRLESYVDGSEIVVKADVPGIDPKNLDVSVDKNILTLKGKREETREKKERDYFHREVSYGGFERSLVLPEGTDAENVKASYNKGVLEIRMPAPKHLAARKVPVEIESGHQEKLTQPTE